ncbi:VanW family protein [Clostridium swellfunianum]|uniref:VanW family protein n=1 Tax=Clostridium swellfunianum TaxID=1367462 RepID=UPI00202DC1C8|nr:VanW family protein [Clostridium swellfunianum]MCM0648377.1 VanW family protein [Clostridium swellfunianum]
MKKKTMLITVVSLLLVTGGAVGARGGYMYNAVKDYSKVIYPEVAIQDINLSGKTKDEAAKILKEKYGDVILKKKFTIKGGEKLYTIDYAKLNASYNIEEAVNQAFAYGKEHNFIQGYKLVKSPQPKNIELKFSYDAKPIKELVAGMQKELDKAPVNATLAFSAGKFSVTPEKNGAKLDAEKLEKDIINKINGDISGDLDLEAPIDVLQASVTAEQLSKVNTKFSTFSTSFSGSTANRIENIRLATKSISGKLLMPGETFSFNDVVGQRTAARGYKEAGVIVNNKLDSGIGGGICQVSSTLYNAVIRANINATERRHHSLPSHYVGLGMDATVDYGNIDYKFKNTLQYPIYIDGYLQGNTLIFNVYSDKSLTAKTYDLVSETYGTIEPTIKYVDDPNMYEGQTETVQKASIGYKVKVYKKIYENGKFVGQETVSDETYKKIDGLVKRGTKKKPQTEAPAPTVNSAPEQTQQTPQQ